MVNTNGWTQHDYKQLYNLLIKANFLNLYEMEIAIQKEKDKRFNVGEGEVGERIIRLGRDIC